MADGKVIIDTKLNASGAEQGIAKLKKGLTGIGSVAKIGLGVAAKAIVAAGTAVTAFGGYAVKAGMDFEAGMSKVGAISGASEKGMEALTKKAKEMGASTKFSATESAEAMSYMAMAGWKTKDMLGGIEGVMNLAAASGEDLATTSDIVTDALTAFGMSAKDSNRFADVLAQTASNANTNVGMMGETFKYVAPVAGALGYSIEDTSVAIGLMANSGIKASNAGTALRSLLTNLSKPSKSVQVAMEQLGISLTDSTGKMKPLNQLMVEMRGSFANLTEEQKAQYAASLAGKTGMSGLLAIVNSSDKDFEKLTDSINNSKGAAKDMADTMQNNLTGQITILKSSIEGLGIEIYNGFSKEVTKFVKSGTDIISNIVKGMQGGDRTAVTTGINDLMNLIVDGIIQATPTVINAAVELIGAFANGIIANTDGILSAIGTVVTNIGNKLSENTDPIVSGLTDMLTKAIDYVSDNLPDMVKFAIKLVGKIASGIIDNIPRVAESLLNLIVSAFKSIPESLPEIKNAGTKIVTSLANALSDGASKLGTSLKNAVGKAFDTIKDVAPFTKPMIDGMEKAWKDIEKAWGGAKEYFNKIFDGAKEDATGAFSKIQDYIGEAWETVQKIWNECRPYFEKVFNSVSSIVSDVFGIVQTVISNAVSKIRPMIQKLQPLFESAFGAARAVAEVVFPAVASLISTVFSRISKIVNTFRPLVEGVFKGAWNAVQTVWNVAADFFTGIFNIIKNIFKGIKAIWQGDFKGAWNAIKGVFASAGSTFLNIGKDIMNGLINGVKNMAGAAVQTVKNVAGNIISGAKSVLGIHSPSRVFKQIGEYTMKGFEVGFVDASGNIVKKVAKTYGEIIKQAEDTAEQSIKHYEDLVKAYNSTAEQINKNNVKRKEILKKQSEDEAELKLKATRKLKDLEKDLHSTNEKTRKSASEKAKKIQTELNRSLSDNKKKHNKEIDELEKEQTKLVEQAEKEKTAVKKAEEKARLDSSKAYYSDETKELLNYYDELNKPPTLLEQVKGLQETVENLKKAREDYETEIESINNTEKTKMQEMLDDYVDKWNKTRETWDSNLDKLKTDYEADLQSIVDAQEKYSKQLADFAGLFGEVKAEDVIDADTILTNAAEQTAKVEKYYKNIEKIQEMNLPQEIVEELRDMGVGAADQLEVFVNMSSTQIDEFVNQWNKRKKISDDLAKKYYSGQKAQREKQYADEKKAMQQQADEEMRIIKADYDAKVRVEADQWAKTLRDSKANYDTLTKQIVSSYNQMYNAQMSSYINSMDELRREASIQATAIGNAIKDGIENGSYISYSEAKRIADDITAPILECVRENLEIHSPSRVFAEIGDLCLQGFEQPFEKYNPTDLMKPSVNSVLNSVNRANSQSQQITNNNNTTNAPVMNFYDSAVSPDAVMRQYNKTMRYGLAGGIA